MTPSPIVLKDNEIYPIGLTIVCPLFYFRSKDLLLSRLWFVGVKEVDHGLDKLILFLCVNPVPSLKSLVLMVGKQVCDGLFVIVNDIV
eukprot:m.129756 g.129756  ORF g.129756 m.129756 type:complete len:88 (+) comp13051_c0_seq1:816-1079(+)